MDTMRLGKMRSTSGGRGHRRASTWRVVGVAALLLAVLAASVSLLALPTSAYARTLSAEPAGGGFVENSDHTWTLYAYGHVIKVYSAAEKETIDRVWHAEEYDLTGNALGSEVTGISHAEAEAAEGLVKRLRTGKPYATKGEREVGEGLMRTSEEKGIISKSAETLFGGIDEKTMFAGSPYAVAIKVSSGFEREFTLPAWTVGSPTGKKEYGEAYGHIIRHYWSWVGSFFTSGRLIPCSSITWATGLSSSETCVYAWQPVHLTEESWNRFTEKYESYEYLNRGGDESGSGPAPFACPGDGPYPSCEETGTEAELDIGEWVDVTTLEGLVGETGFPAAGLGGYVPKGYEELSGENTSTPAYNYGSYAEATPLSNPHVAPLADELEIAYALQSSLLPGLEGEVVPSPGVPGEVPVEAGQTRCGTADPVACATGNYSESQTDMQIGGRGVGLDLTRYYSAQAAAAGVKGIFGYGWSSSFSDHLVLEPAVHLVLLVTAEGTTVPFTESEGSFKAPAASQYKLSGSTEAGYTVTLPDQTLYKFQGSSGRLESVTDRDGNETKLAYSTSSGLLETVTDPAGRELTFKENAEGFVESVKDPMGHEVKYTYENETLASVTLAGESSPRWSFKTEGPHEITEMTDGRGGKTINKYNAYHQVEEQTDPMKHTIAFSYEPLQTKITNKATEAVTLEQFTPNGEPSSVTHGYGTSLATTESWEYTEAGYVKKKTDGNKHSIEYGYNEAGDKTSEKNADGGETKWEYDKAHDVISVTTPKGETTTIKREAHGNPEVIERPAPGSKTQTTKYKYTTHGELESVTNPLEHTWKYEYDSKGDRTAEIDPEGNKRTWEYNEDSQEIATVSPRGNVTGGKPAEFTIKIERDTQGRPLTVTDPLGHTTKYKYDGDGNVETATDGNSHTTTYTYNADNQPTKVEYPNKTVTETEYDGAGQVTAQIDGNKHKTKYKRNILEEATEVTDPLGHVTTEEYDSAGNLTKRTDPAKRTTTYTYDPANRLTEISYSSGKPSTVKYEYDKDGDRTKMTDGTGTTTYTYDQLDRLTESENGHKEVIKYEYNLGNEQTKTTYPNGKAVERAYDKDGRLEKVTDWNKKETKFTYDQDSDLKLIAFPSETKDEDTYVYNDADQMTEVKMKKSSETLGSLVYTRDNDGQVKKTTAKGLPGTEVTEVTYDENNRLSKYGNTEYKYDSANNPTKEGSSENTYNEGNELEKGTGVTYSYDELGERTKTNPSTGPATTYGYDQAGDLTSVERPKEGEKTEIKDSYEYNGEGLRTSQTLNSTTSYLAWDMTEELPLILSDGTNSYINGPGGLPVEQINNTTGTVSYLHHDQQGSTRLLTGSTGTVTGKCSYSAYGTPTCEGTATTPLGWDGQYTSSDTGLVYLRNRVYDPTTAQFLTVDPAVALTREPYAYGGDNPVNRRDPDGLSAEGLEGVPCYFPFCGPPPPAVEGVQHGIEGITHGIESVWNSVNENEGPNDEGEAALKEKEAQRAKECGEPNPGNLEKVGDREIKRILEEEGTDPHTDKGETVGGEAGRYDYYRDKTTGEIYLAPKGGGEPIPTGLGG